MFPGGENGTSRRFALAIFSVVALVSLLVFLSWLTGSWRLGSFGQKYIPMAPSTAIAFFLMASAGASRVLRPGERASLLIIFSVACLVAAVSLLVLARSLLGFKLLWEAWLSPASARTADIPVGLMSPATAGFFLLASLAQMLIASPKAGRRTRNAASLLSACILGFSVIILMSYALDVPLLYGGRTVPVALLTAASFVLLGAGLLLTSGSFPGEVFLRGPAQRAPEAARRRRMMSNTVSLFILLAAILLSVGYLYLREQVQRSREKALLEMDAVAGLIAQQIADWHGERLDNARIIHRNPAVQSFAASVLGEAGDAEAQKKLESWLAGGLETYEFTLAALLGSDGEPKLILPPGPGSNPLVPSDSLAAASRAGGVWAGDLRFEDRGDAGLSPGICLDFLIPIGAGRGAGKEPIGFILLRVDPGRVLFPMVQGWPIPSDSAEILLVRREGDEVVYLNDLRHQRHTALKLRKPISLNPELPAVQGILGKEGMIRGKDYRGIWVLSSAKRVPGTSWTVVAKVDENEIYGPIRRQAVLSAGLILSLFLALALAVSLSVKRRDEQWLLRQIGVERARQDLADRILQLHKQANDDILLMDKDWKILEANDRAFQAYGYPRDKLLSMSFRDLRAPDAKADFDRQVRQFEARKGVVNESRHMRSDGTVFPVESSLQAMDIGGERYYQAIIRDITDRKTIERELQRRMEQLHSLAAHLQEAREEERGALARELHDELAQTMTALKMDLAMLKTEVAGRPAGDAECRETVLKSIEEMTDLVQETIALVRRMITELRPGVLDQLGLADALAWQAEEFQKRNGIPCFLETSGGTSLDKRRSVAVFRVFQEALTNIARHAAATRVTVSLEEVEGIVRLRVSDDGRGLPSDFMTGGGGFGLIGMRERALMLGGKLDISSRPGQGTTIELSIPAGWEQGGGP